MHFSFILFAALGQPLLGAATSTIKPLPTTLLSLPLPASPLPTIVDPIPSPASTLLSGLTLPATLTSLVRPTKTIHLLPSKTKSYSECGGYRPTPPVCAAGFACIDDPWVGGCGQSCDFPGICVQEIQCGGFVGKACPAGMYCIDDPRDKCDPKKGGADCIGICI
ncbi:proteinase inhibitor kazal [Colletotrichum kahawae]|uniref:Proteinase inhibitor kazal n=1 Tax=Colletotrichum kahawae TaxID=34407 RepID=A0AAE0D2R8_COLKA|nr:proteinase inhibitor kazal [Colletotrichum kahawae]